MIIFSKISYTKIILLMEVCHPVILCKIYVSSFVCNLILYENFYDLEYYYYDGSMLHAYD